MNAEQPTMRHDEEPELSPDVAETSVSDDSDDQKPAGRCYPEVESD